MATAAMVCGIVGIFLFFLLVLPIVAVVLGAISLGRAKAAPGPGTGSGRAWAGLILGIIGLLLFVGLVIGVVLGWFGEDVGADELEVGQCVELDTDATEISTLPLVDCDETHQGEVYFVTDLEGGDTFPGQDAVIERGQELCVGEPFEDYVGTPYLRSALEIFTVYPTEETWDAGDREVSCLVIRPDGGDMTSSVRGSGS
jgi:hypothetical protein